jgi:hypothetical protein
VQVAGIVLVSFSLAMWRPFVGGVAAGLLTIVYGVAMELG